MSLWKHLGLTMIVMAACLSWAFRADVRLPLVLLLAALEAAMLYSVVRHNLTAAIITTITMAIATGYVIYAFAGWGTLALAIPLGGGLVLFLYPHEQHT